MRNRNENQSKHIANSLRIVGMAQFAHYGYIGLQDGDAIKIYSSACVYFIMEVMAYFVLKKKEC
jgi:hypothetical protein